MKFLVAACQLDRYAAADDDGDETMASNATSFPFPALPPGEVTPSTGPGDIQELLQRDIRIVRWFIEERWRKRSDPASPLGHLLTLSEQADLKGPAKTVDELDREVARHGLYLSSTLVRVAWAVRALHGNGGAIDQVDGTFIDDELLGEDSKQRDIERKLPAGVGTLVLAGRLVQAGQGRIISINGHRGVGHDIKWVTAQGDTVYVERKDRSYEAGLADTPEKRVARVIEETRKAGLAMPRERGASRVLVVGFQHLVRKSEVKHVERGYSEALRSEFGRGRVRAADLPHIVIVEHLGLEPKTGGAKLDFFSPHSLSMKPRELMRRVARLFVKALGARL
jgi:hypothetical protein